MFKKKDNTYSFISNKKEFSVDVLNNETIEVYETENPLKTGFIMNGRKAMTSFINNFTDIVEDINQEALELKEALEEENENKRNI